ncbi:unnamed protein product [Candida verbasci]|uniref:Uncharacterized protein n=1 Tax=Candida verbasci TaxID=1227364 RepID=A0A9W4XAL0_9ASCO|nr:unnamed protein product [Candida verbasci]
MFYIKAQQRVKFTQQLFTSTFAICFLLVGANSILPCPVDSNYGNDSNEKFKKQQEIQKRKQQIQEQGRQV